MGLHDGCGELHAFHQVLNWARVGACLGLDACSLQLLRLPLWAGGTVEIVMRPSEGQPQNLKRGHYRDAHNRARDNLFRPVALRWPTMYPRCTMGGDVVVIGTVGFDCPGHVEMWALPSLLGAGYHTQSEPFHQRGGQYRFVDVWGESAHRWRRNANG